MTEATKTRLLKKLGKAIAEVTETKDELPTVMPAGHVSQHSGQSLVWEGLYEWTMITAGSSVYSGMTGSYSTPTEDKIAKVIKEIESLGGYLEAENHWAVSIYT